MNWTHRTMQAALAVCIVFLALTSPAAAKIGKEQKLGQEQARMIERRAKLVENEEMLDRVRRIGSEIAEIARTVKVPATYGSDDLAEYSYEFKIIDDDDINAFSLIGGYIYVNRGLIEYVENDDQLAGVLAHEIAHAAHHHVSALVKKQSAIDRYVALLAIVALLGDVRPGDLNNLVYGAHLVKIARLSGYGQAAELDADRTAIHYLAQTSYSPTGLLTFLEKLGREKEFVSRNLGILQTHPPSRERASLIADELESLGIQVNRRRLTNAPEARVREVDSDQGTMPEVVIAGELVLRPSAANGLSASERADEICNILNGMLESGMHTRDLRLDESESRVAGTRGTVILTVTEEDALCNSMTRQQLAQQAHHAIRQAIWEDWIRTFPTDETRSSVAKVARQSDAGAP